MTAPINQSISLKSLTSLTNAISKKGSPADGIVQVNDVILGVFGKPFADDARRSFGHNSNAEADASDAGMVFGQMPRGKTDATMDDIQIFFLGSPQFRK